MFDLGMGEMAVIGIVALIVVGPKELPTLFRNVGNLVGKAQGMAREFSRAMNAAAADSGVKDIKDTLNGANQMMKAAANPKAYGAQKLREAVAPGTPTSRAEAEAKLSEAAMPSGVEALAKEASTAGVGKPSFGTTPVPPPVSGPFAPPGSPGSAFPAMGTMPPATPAAAPVSQGTPVPLPPGAVQPQVAKAEAPLAERSESPRPEGENT